MNKYLKIRNNVILVNNYLYPRAIVATENEGKVYPINSTGVRMLSHCDGTKTIHDIVEIISETYQVDKKIVQRDAEDFFEKEIQLGLVQIQTEKVKAKVDFRGREDIILPYQLSIETTNRCQLKCKHCYNKSGEKRINELTNSEIIEVLGQYKELGGISVMLTGGEIFLRENITELIDYVAQNFYRVVILSNGFSISEDILNKLEYFKNRIAIQISIDGIKKNHDFIRGVDGAYDKTIENIKRLIKRGIIVTIASVLNEHNYKDIDELVQIVKKLGCKSINIGAVSSIGRAKETKIGSIDIVGALPNIVEDMRHKYEDGNFNVGINVDGYGDVETLEGEILRNKCGAGYKLLHLFSDGKIGICPSNGSIIDSFYINDVRKEKLSEILKFENMHWVLDIPTPSKEFCTDCEHYDECGQCIISMLSRETEECSLKRKLIDEKIVSV